MFIALLFIMYVRANMFIWPLFGSRAWSSIPWKITGGSPCEHLGSSFQRERNNNLLYDVFHMRSMTRTRFFFLFSDYFVLHQMCWSLGKKEGEEKERDKSEGKWVGERKKWELILNFNWAPAATQTVDEGGRGETQQLRRRDGWMDVDVEREEGREWGARQSHSV